ncbi:MAG: S8 family serine peptidase [Gammaproteobacteria bacterium]|nr:MAG: S8 family serine peptidase [Gammaproteobacteria bacterium]
MLVKIADGVNHQDFLKRANSAGFGVRGRVYNSNWYTLYIPAATNPQAAARTARALRGAARASVDLRIQMLADTVPPQDPFYQDGATYCDPLFELCIDQWGLFKVNAESAWVKQTGSPGVVIAVIDSGVDLDHDDLYGNIWTNPGEIAGNGIDDDGNGIVDDSNGVDFSGANVGGFSDAPADEDANPDIPMGGSWYTDPSNVLGLSFAGDAAVGDNIDNNSDGYPDLGVFHGTAVAGVAAAMANNLVPGSSTAYEGMAGACWHCSIMPVRVVHAEGDAFLSDAASGINYAAAEGADIINASWGFSINGRTPDSPEVAVISEAIGNAYSQGTIIVAAAGNAGVPGVYYPAADQRVIAVGSSSQADLRSAFSSYGFINEVPGNGLDDDGNGWIDDTVDVVAPGEGIWSSWVFAAYDSFLYTYFFGYPPEDWPPGIDTYSAADGTSFSAPLVAGYLGLLQSECPDISLSQARQILYDNATDTGTPGYDAETGHGRLVMAIPDQCPTTTGNASPTAVITGDLTVLDKGKPGSELISLDGSSSFDEEDGNLLTDYLWHWNGPDSGSASGVSLSVQLVVGDYEVSLTVTDSNGAMNTASATVSVLPKGGDGDGGDPGDTSGGNEKGSKKCSDGIDNDGDGAIDGDDLGCN